MAEWEYCELSLFSEPDMPPPVWHAVCIFPSGVGVHQFGHFHTALLELGLDGWELVCYVEAEGKYIFKRQVI